MPPPPSQNASLQLLLALRPGDGHAHVSRDDHSSPPAPRHRAMSWWRRAQRVQDTSPEGPAHGGWGGGGSVRCPLPQPPSPRPGRPRLPVRVLVSPGGRSRRRSVRAIGVFGPLQLHLEPLHADLESVHGLDGGLRAGRVVKAHESCRDRGGPAMVGNVGVFHSASQLGVLGAGRVLAGGRQPLEVAGLARGHTAVLAWF